MTYRSYYYGDIIYPLIKCNYFINYTLLIVILEIKSKTLKWTYNRHFCTIKLCKRESLGVLEKNRGFLSGAASIIDISYHLVPSLTYFHISTYKLFPY